MDYTLNVRSVGQKIEEESFEEMLYHRIVE